MTLLIGGARAGKSSLAARLATNTSLPVAFIATAEAKDDEMAERIARHRSDRPKTWITIEEPIELMSAFEKAGSDRAVVLDCLTLWVSNLMLSGLDEQDIVERASEVATSIGTRGLPTFVVTNEVGAGVHPSSDMGRRFRDVLGRVNAIWAQHATEVLLVVAGRTLTLQAPTSL